MPISREVKGLLVRQDDQIERIKKLLSERQIPYATIVAESGSTYIVTLTSKEEILLTSESDLSAQVASLQVILTRLTMESKRFRRLDLRFDKPVIMYK